MRTTSLFSVIALCSLSLAACAKDAAPTSSEPSPPIAAEGKGAVKQATAEALAPLPQKKFGETITEKSSTALDSMLKEPTKCAAQTVRTEGVVSAVCQEMGCWMEITDEAGNAHIKMAGHSFFIPKQANGHRAVVQGKVLNDVHDSCSDEAKAQTGKVAKLQIEATGVEFLD